jgi:hypothetical protein
MRGNPIWVRSILLGMMFLAIQARWQVLTAAEAPGKTGDKAAAQTLKAEDKDGLPVPANYTDYSGESSAYIHSITANSPSPLKTVLEFYQKELKALKWRELPAAPGNTGNKALLIFENDKKERLSVKLIRNADGATGISLNLRKDGEAKAAGVVPPPGKARVYLGNMTERPVVFVLDRKKYNVKKESTSDNSMKDAPFADLPPGKHAFTLTLSAQKPVNDTFEIGPDETWGLIAGPGGAMPIRIY